MKYILYTCVICCLLSGCSKEGKDVYAKYTIAYDQYTETQLDVYTPINSIPSKSLPVMVFIHGGGWSSGDKHSWASKVPYFCTIGYISVSINYRLSPKAKHPAHITDIANAIAWIVGNIDKYGGDASQLTLVGHSSGAHLALLSVTNQQYLQRAGVDVLDIKKVYSLDAGGYLIMNELVYDNPTILSKLYDAVGDDFGTDAWRDFAPYNFISIDQYIPEIVLIYSDEKYRYDANTLFKEKLDSCNIESVNVLLRGYDHSNILRDFPHYTGTINLF